MISSDVLDESEKLFASGDPGRAIDLLTAANRQSRCMKIERRLVELRHEEFKARLGDQKADDDGSISPRLLENQKRVDDPFPDVRGQPPEVHSSELTAEVVRGAIQHHGCLIVRGFVDRDRADLLAEYTNQAMSTAAQFSADPKTKPDEWYAPFRATDTLNPFERVWTRDCGTLYAGDCPRVLFELIEVFDEVGFDKLSTDYFGERTAISLQKCAVRKVYPEKTRQIDTSMWHQDGRFLGDGVQALNIWIALTDAGVDAPGMDVVPRRFDGLVTSGTGSAGFDWTVGEEVVGQVAADTPVVTPEFAAGDAIIFDELFLHTTSVKPGMDQNRLSSETWFIAESTYPPDKWVPLSL